MPDFNTDTQQGRGEWGLRCITDHAVLIRDRKPACVEHGAMNAVNLDRSIWRCLMCARACYRIERAIPLPPRRAQETDAEYNRRAYWWRTWAAQERPDLWFVSAHEVAEWQQWKESWHGQ
jgi:hypothetical protein